MADREGKESLPAYYVVADLAQLQASSDSEKVFLRYLGVLRRRIWVLISVLVIAVTVGVFNAFRAPVLYMAQSKLVVDRDIPKVAGFEGVIRDSSMWDPEFYNTQVELIRSRVVMETALEDPAVRTIFEDRPEEVTEEGSFLREARDTLLALLGGSPPPPPAMWERLRGSFSVKRIMDTRFVIIQATGADPRTVATVVNAVANAFETYNQRERALLNGEAFAFLQRERDKEEKALVDSERAFQEFRSQAKALGFSLDSENQPISERLSQINRELAKVQLERIDLESHSKVVEDITSGRLGPVAVERLLALPQSRADTAVSKAWDQYVEAQKTLRSLSRIYGPEHPALKDAQTNEVSLKDELFAALLRSVQANKDRLAVLQNKEQELLKQYDELKNMSLEASKEAIVFSRLQAEVERHRRLYDALLQKILELDVSSDLGRNIVTVVELADVPKTPVDPQRGRRLLFALILGALLGVGAAFVVENLDETIRTPEDLRDELTVPLLGFVPPFESPPDFGKSKSEYGARLILNEPVSSAAEAFRTIRTSLYFSIPSGEAKLIAVTSCGSGEGKTTTAANLALAIALSGKKVMLIDGDFHQPKVGVSMGLKSKIGMSDILVGEVDWRSAVQKIEHDGQIVEGLDVIVAGTPTPSPAELLGSDKMSSVLRDLRSAYDWVIVDTPPVLFASDAAIVCALSDGIILVVMAGVNNRSLLRRAVDHLKQLRVRIVGAVLTRMTAAMFGSYASDYAYHGYSRYSRDYHSAYYGRKGGSRVGKAAKKQKGADVSRKRANAGS